MIDVPEASTLEFPDSVCAMLTSLVRLMVDNPQRVLVGCQDSPKGTLFTISVDSRDLGKLIGRGGRTARSIRVLLAAVGKTVRRILLVEFEAPV